jgi:bacteriophage N4 adsorption protein B
VITAATSALPDVLRVLVQAERELLLFAAFWFIVSAIDEVCIDLTWLWLRLTGRAKSGVVPPGSSEGALSGRIAVFVPAWQEANVLGAMIAHTLAAWRHGELSVFVGCYVNDLPTLQAAMAGAGDDPRVRIVVNAQPGPSTKADCLNRLYRALEVEEARCGQSFRAIVLHDAEDMVHPAGLAAIDRALDQADFVQLPVRPIPQRNSPWVAGHYADEFAEAHAKTLVVRDAIGAAIPSAGVGCGFAREALARLEREKAKAGDQGPFAPECLTEDYELGLLIARHGGRGKLLRLRDANGGLVATHSFFPATLDEAVRQKSRWVHGIALQGWERLGWPGGPLELWMAFRDRRGPLTALVLTAAYLLIVVEGLLGAARLAGWQDSLPYSPGLQTMILLSLIAFIWRAMFRFGFTAREYGWAEGIRAVLRIPVANLVAILAGRRAMAAYLATLTGAKLHWEKTQHSTYPATRELLGASV